MKDYYKINEVSKLYDIGVDSLRYYERLGILKPHRDTNGYRLYNLKDMYQLTVIRSLRQLDFSMAQIKEYLDGQGVDKTLDLMHQEQQLLQQQIQKMQNQNQLLQERIEALTAAKEIQPGVLAIKEMPKRVCVRLNQFITRDEEMDFVIKKLHRKHEDKIRDIGNQIVGAFFSVEALKQGRANVYDSVFFVLEDGSSDFDFVLPKGRYASWYYRGSYQQNARCVSEMLRQLELQNITPAGEPFELYEIDNRDTINEQEFLTEIQIRVQGGQ